MIEITSKHGLSKYSSLGLVFLGAFLSTEGDKFGYEVGNYALFLLHKMRVKEMFPIVYSAYYSFILPYNASVHLSHAPLLKAYRVGLETGNIDISALTAFSYCLCAFMSGRNLENLGEEVMMFNRQLPIKSM